MNTEPNQQIAIAIPDNGLPPSMLANIRDGFAESFEQAEKWREQALSIRVTSLEQRAEMKLARTIRLELKNIRVRAEHSRKKLKEDSLRYGRAVDGVNNLLLAAIVPLEEHLEAQEKYAEKLAEEQRLRVQAERSQALAPYLAEGQILPPLDAMTDEQWSSYLADAKLLHEAKIEAARKAEAERIAREQAEAAERERIRLENERLKKEAEAREAAMKAEREAAAKAQREAEEKAKKEREAIEAKARAEREAAEKKAAQERAELEAKAKAEREAREKLERELAEKKAAEEMAAKAEAAAKRREANAPDKVKLKSFAKAVRSLSLPILQTGEANAINIKVQAKMEEVASWIEKEAERL